MSRSALSAPRTVAFTLIELLVVVAVIAILAAIAVPNFLEAQTRAKVSRAKADLRTYATAIEAYTVDWNRAPYDGEPGFVFYGWVNGLSQVTTPVAYLTTLQPDIFQDSTITQPTRPGHTHNVNATQHSYDYSSAYWNDIPNDPVVTPQWQRRFGNAAWKMSSCGPDRRFINGGSYFGMEQVYDPSNGTVSAGDIARWQGGGD